MLVQVWNRDGLVEPVMQLFLQQVARPLEEFGACAEAAAEFDIAKRRRHIFIKVLGATVPLSFTLKSIQQMMGRPTPITWNHRVLLTEEQGEKSYCIHEVHYDEDGSVMGWTQSAIAVFPSFAELILM